MGEGDSRKTKVPASLLMILGLVLLIIPFAIALVFFFVFEPPIPASKGSLNEALVDASFGLISIASRLAFLGIAVWVGSIILRNAVELMRGG
ncbi:MAG: hypothetical protein QXI22_08685 [Sulfolobales archaeon]